MEIPWLSRADVSSFSTAIARDLCRACVVGQKAASGWIVDADGNVIGKVTSGTQSPSLQKAIGLGYVKNEFAKEGSDIYISIRDNKVKAQVVKPPFYK